MINLTDKIIVIEKDDLDIFIRVAILSVLVHISLRHDPPSARSKWRSRHAFNHIFDEARIKEGCQFDEDFLQAALAFNKTASRNKGASTFFAALGKYLQDPHPPADAIASVKQGIKLVLVELWSRGAILLPTVFVHGRRFESAPSSNELYDFVASYKPAKGQEPTSLKGRITGARSIYYYMPRVLTATSWRKVEDVNIEELADLQRAQRLFMSGSTQSPIITSPVPWSLFLNELLQAFPTRVSFNQDKLKRYSNWLTGRGLAECSFSEFLLIKEKVREKVPAQFPRRVSASKAPVVERLIRLSEEASHDAARRYFENYRWSVREGIGWLDQSPAYPGREHVRLENSVELWRSAFHAFLHYRRHVKGYESDRGAVSALNILADYLFLYLPWWKELFPQSCVDVPRAPKGFLRYAFVYRSTDEDISDFPVIFPEMLKLRRITRDSQYAALKQIQLFFKFVEANFSEDNEVAGSKFRNPIFGEFDIPRIKKRGKTSKIVFPKNSYSYLICYGYAVEAFGQFLLERSLAGHFHREELRTLSTSRFIDTAAFGYIPYVQYRGKLTPLDVVPNVFIWAERNIKTSEASSVKAFIPHLTTLRVLIAAVEVGLRLSALRWLDRRTWDKNNLDCHDSGEFSFRPDGQYVYEFHVNTDKVKEGARDTLVVFRVRALLLREQRFQLSIDELGMDAEAPYMKRPLSRFGNILPLFRSISNSNPISDDYYREWTLYMIGFQGFFGRANGSLVSFVKILPTSSTTASPKIMCDKNGVQYCPVSILTISTPHACRASFATNRQGILETSEIAKLIGHEDPLVTSYYQSPRAEDLKQKLELSDKAIHEGYRTFDKNDPAYVRPDSEDSTLVRSFRSDRESTIGSFGFMPPMSLWKLAESEGMDEGAIDALRNGPMSLIRFRETHICPVGEECPTEIVQAIGGFKRCGLCPLALKCVDHLPPIAAKKHALIERIKYLLRQKDALEETGETAAVEAVWEELDLETNELLGWQLSEEILSKMYLEQLETGSSEVIFHAAQPDVVKRHLQRVVKQSGPTEFLLRRIAEANAYPSLQSPQVQAIAASIRRRLLAGQEVPDLLTEAPSAADVGVAASLLKTVMQANGLTVKEMSARLDDRSVALPASALLRIGGSS